MIKNPIKNRSNTKQLGPEDVLEIRHHFMICYGWISEQDWEDIPLDVVFDLWPKVQEEYRKKEEMRLCTLKYYGVKNPK